MQINTANCPRRAKLRGHVTAFQDGNGAGLISEPNQSIVRVTPTRCDGECEVAHRPSCCSRTPSTHQPPAAAAGRDEQATIACITRRKAE